MFAPPTAIYTMAPVYTLMVIINNQKNMSIYSDEPETR
jgi:hypothetical protein